MGRWDCVAFIMSFLDVVQCNTFAREKMHLFIRTYCYLNNVYVASHLDVLLLRHVTCLLSTLSRLYVRLVVFLGG